MGGRIGGVGASNCIGGASVGGCVSGVGVGGLVGVGGACIGENASVRSFISVGNFEICF